MTVLTSFAGKFPSHLLESADMCGAGTRRRRRCWTFLLGVLFSTILITYPLRYTTEYVTDSGEAQKTIVTARPYSLIYFLTPPHFGGDRLWYLGEEMSNPFLMKKCKYSNCRITSDAAFANLANLIVFHGPLEAECCSKLEKEVHCTDGHEFTLSNYSLPPLTSTNAIVYFQNEAPSRTNQKCLLPLDDAVNYTWSYKPDSDIFRPYGGYSIQRPGAGQPNIPNFQSHSRNVLWYVSNCHATKETKSRYAYAIELAKYIDVDIYGSCSGRSDGCPRKDYACMLKKRQQYLFYLAFENSHCEGYVTEKFFDSLKYGNLPIVRGLPKSQYSTLAPPNSFVHADDFPEPRELAAHLKMLARSPAELLKYHEWRKTYQLHDPDKRHNYIMHESASICKLCQLATLRPQKTVRVSEWWSAERNCML